MKGKKGKEKTEIKRIRRKLKQRKEEGKLI